jgi:hypothetical protein
VLVLTTAAGSASFSCDSSGTKKTLVVSELVRKTNTPRVVRRAAPTLFHRRLGLIVGPLRHEPAEFASFLRRSAVAAGTVFDREDLLMTNQEKTDLQAAETAFKQRLLKLGLLTKIAPPTSGVKPRERMPIPVAGNAVSELIIRERR